MQEEARNGISDSYKATDTSDSHKAVDTSEVDSSVVANMNAEAEESVEFNTKVEDAEVGVAQATLTTVASEETGEVEESHSILEIREIEESNSTYPYPSDQQATVEITETESHTTIQGEVAASEDLPEESGVYMNSEEGNINSALAMEENQRINVNSPVYPSLYSGESRALFLDIDEEYVQPDPDSFLDFDPCGVDVDFYGYEYHENVRQQRREAEGVVSGSYEAENETDAVVDLDEAIAAEYKKHFNNTPISVRRDISEEGVVNSPVTDNQDISEDINKDVSNSPSELSQDISGEEDIDIVMPMPRPNSQGEIIHDCIIARSDDPLGNRRSEYVASGLRESYL